MNYANLYPGVFSQTIGIHLCIQMFNNQIPLKYPYLVCAEFWLGSALAVPVSAVVSGGGRFLTSVLDLEAKCGMHIGCCKPELQHPRSFCIVATFSYNCSSLTSSFLPSLSFLAVPDRMALSLSLCLRLTITPIPLKEGQGVAKR